MIRASVLSSSILALGSFVAAAPLSSRDFGGLGDVVPIYAVGNDVFDSSSVSVSSFSSSQSFNLWGGLSSLYNFDNFYGADNFCGNQNVQTFTSQVQCQTVDITVLQQQLAILAEFAKRIITTEVCEVETQTIVWQQYLGGLQSFSDDIRHVSSRQISFDSSIASQISDLCDSEGNINTDFDFSGSSIGSDSVSILGCDWNDQTSPALVSQAFQDCESAAGFSLEGPTASTISSGCGNECPLSLPPSSSDCSSSDCSVSVDSSSGCDSSDCSDSATLPPSSDCDSSDCSDSVTPPPSSDCDSSDCSISSDTSDCESSDCSASLAPPSSSDCDSSDCSISTDTSDCGSSDCSDSTDSLDSAGLPVETDSAGSPTDSADSAAPTDDSDDDDSAAPTDDSDDDDSAAPTDDSDDDDSAAPTDDSDGDDSAAPTDDSGDDDSAAPTDDSDDSSAPTATVGSIITAVPAPSSS